MIHQRLRLQGVLVDSTEIRALFIQFALYTVTKILRRKGFVKTMDQRLVTAAALLDQVLAGRHKLVVVVVVYSSRNNTLSQILKLQLTTSSMSTV